MAVTFPSETKDPIVPDYEAEGLTACRFLSGRVSLSYPGVAYEGPLANMSTNVIAVLTYRGQPAKAEGLITALRARGLAL